MSVKPKGYTRPEEADEHVRRLLKKSNYEKFRGELMQIGSIEETLSANVSDSQKGINDRLFASMGSDYALKIEAIDRALRKIVEAEVKIQPLSFTETLLDMYSPPEALTFRRVKSGSKGLAQDRKNIQKYFDVAEGKIGREIATQQ